MNLQQALQGVQRLCIDTAPLIYLIERHPRYFELMLNIVQAISQGELRACSTVLTLTEVLTQPLRVNNSNLVQAYEAILQDSVGFQLVPIDTTIARLSAELRAKYALKTPDAIQIATATHMNCQAFLTNDLGLKRVQELRILVLSDLTLRGT
ncbi:MAG: PIN domain-containing protein [Chloroflexi bacterium CFX4]|nr:PIN domain-containing protein [Chloroflexi bacterium CFX4]MDL1923320.1 type II toxin-antitoxin system VapC family toxin [Chloroflexi bacterium CFX3]